MGSPVFSLRPKPEARGTFRQQNMMSEWSKSKYIWQKGSDSRGLAKGWKADGRRIEILLSDPFATLLLKWCASLWIISSGKVLSSIQVQSFLQIQTCTNINRKQITYMYMLFSHDWWRHYFSARFDQETLLLSSVYNPQPLHLLPCTCKI